MQAQDSIWCFPSALSLLQSAAAIRIHLFMSFSFSKTGCLALTLVLAGCGRPANSVHPVPEPPFISRAEPGVAGGKITLSCAGNPKSFNPVLAIDSASDNIVRLLFSSLLRFDQRNQEPGPGLAESWSVEPDQKTWTFKLRKGLRWSNGQPLTALDVAFTWNQIMYDPQFNRMTLDVFQIGGKNFSVTNLDELTVRVVTPEVYAPFLEFFGSVAILPKHVLSQAVQRKAFLTAYGLGTPPASVIGSGPYRLKEFRPGKFALLERNPEFWMVDKAGQRLPYFEEITMAINEGPGPDSLPFLNGKTDVCEVVRPHEYGQFKEKSRDGRFRLVELGIGGERDFLWFNQNTGTNRNGSPIVNPSKLKWFRNKKFRQAVSCAIDRERLVRDIYAGRAQAAYTFISTENPKWNNPNLPRFELDPARARKLLEEIGITDRNGSGVAQDSEGTSLEISFVSNIGNPAREKAAAMIQEDLRKIGIKLIYIPVPFELLRIKVDRTFDYECAMMGLGGGGIDPATQINVLRSSEALHQWFPFQASPSTDWEARLDTLMDQLMHTLDLSARKKAFDEVQMILGEEQPMIYTVSPIGYAAVRSNIANVQGLMLSPYRVTWNIEELYFTKR
jgi:peptide/nickel transport system substrate-binding protein